MKGENKTKEQLINEATGMRKRITELEELETERKKAEGALQMSQEEALQESEERFKSLFLTMSEGVCLHEVIYDKSGKAIDYIITEVNPAYESTLNMDKERTMGSRASELYGSGEPPYLDIYAKVADTGVPNHFETYFPPMDKHFSISVFSPSQGRFATVFTDITERKRAAEELQKAYVEVEKKVEERTKELSQSNRDLTNINQELESFSYAISHDLRAPLRSIDGFSHILQEDYIDRLDEKGNDCLQRILSAAQRMRMLIDGVLNLSRIARGEVKWELVDLSSLVQSIAAELQESQPQRQVEFIIAPGLTANGNAHLLRILLENLLGNAWKFTGKHLKARIEFGTTQVDGEEAFFVRDNGAGFDMTYADKLFGIFQRLHTADEFPGVGVGLATVQRVVNHHGGRVWAEGEVEKGATFYFTL